MHPITFRDDLHKKRFAALLNRANKRMRHVPSIQSILYLTTGNIELLKIFNDYFFPETGEFFFKEMLEDERSDRSLFVQTQLVVQLYNGRTTLTIAELIDHLTRPEMELALNAIAIRALGVDQAELRNTINA
ncbi:hypothetical protein [Exiguobacterium flavidum]|uniref:hypothetical protein n=1 Tax=Exiguobacterium flavidum TaxID=2184695 RepID=UPI000DF7E0DA|nr:hypothetical protein [Exiguobacterium flavidum]